MDKQSHAISTKELILKQNKREGGTETFVYEPSNIEEEPLGNLYVIGWMKSGQKEPAFVPNLIASLMRREFYKPSEEPAETLFETALKKANAALADITASDNTQDLPGLCAINITAGKIRFAQTAPLKALLYRDNGVSDISHRNREKNKKESFPSVVTGDIFPGDKLIFGTTEVFDLFSDNGIKKLGSLNQSEQAEIISGLYQKNAKTASLPDQAAILLDVRREKEKRAIAKPISAVGDVKNKIIKETRKFEIKFNRKHKIITGLIALFIIMSPLYLAAQARLATAGRIRRNISEAERISSTDKESARLLLLKAQTDLPALFSNWYLAGDAQKISDEIDRKIGALDGIYKETLAEVAALDLSALKFLPQHIFDVQNTIYVFNSTADLTYKISKNAIGNAAFVPLVTGEQFAIERALEKDGDIYLINDSKQAAYIFYPSIGETAKVAKTLKKILGTPSKQNSRTAGDSVYLADNPGKIIKTTKGRAKPEKFLFGQDISAIDFTLSADAKNIYILTQNKILSIENK